MLSTDITQESITKRIEQVVSILMEENSIFKEDLNYSEIVKHLVELFEKNLHFEEFNTMSEVELKDHCSGIMSIELLGKIGDDFTPEQMAVFDEAIKRK
jgi:ABC-type lipopolysaccharide export system ATPase subunit